MVITENKNLGDILKFLGEAKKIALFGCSECASACGTGGAQQLDQFKAFLQKADKEVLFCLVLDSACHSLGVRKALKSLAENLGQVEAIVSFSCGNGTQTLAKWAGNVPVYPGNDTLFLGETVRAGLFIEACRSCGDCELGWTGGICPVTQCAKGLLNGPCGGAKGRRCEVNTEEECVWLRIYGRLAAINQLENLLEIRPPRNHLKNVHPRKHSVLQKTAKPKETEV